MVEITPPKTLSMISLETEIINALNGCKEVRFLLRALIINPTTMVGPGFPEQVFILEVLILVTMRIKTLETILAHWADSFEGCKTPQSAMLHIAAARREQRSLACPEQATLVLNDERQTINCEPREELALPIRDIRLEGVTFGDWCAYTTATEVATSIVQDILDGIVEGITLHLESYELNRAQVFSNVEKALNRAIGAVLHSRLSGGRYASLKKAVVKELSSYNHASGLRKITNAIWRLVSEWNIEAL